MNSFIKLAIERPIAVIAFMVLIVMFGFVAARTIPIQMSPDIEKPIFQVRVNWAGATPEDVDREIVNRLEDELSNLSSVEEISSNSRYGSARITLTYAVGTNMDKALTLLLTKLSGITNLPREAKAPQVRTSNSDDSPIARLALTALPGQEIDVETLGRFVDNELVSRLERVPGVAEVTYYGGGSQQMSIRIHPEKLVRFRLSISEVANALRQSSAVLSAGAVDQGKRTYAVRTQSDLFTPETAGAVVIRNDMTADGQLVPILLRDIADIELEMEKRSSFRRLNGKNALILNALREQGTNVVQTMQTMQTVIDTLNQSVLAQRGLELKLVYDETKYIDSALQLVQQNIWVGGLLALSVLVLFLRSTAPTLIIAAAIPISVIGTFVVIAALGLSINVISLAGLAFAVGMVVDASIVSQENIFRLRQAGRNAANSAYHGARQVWAPILGSALTTVIVFIPVILLDLPIGQLFRDIGIAISVAVLISVLVSATVIPSISATLLKGDAERYARPFRLPVIDGLAKLIHSAVVSYARFTVKRRLIGLGLVVLMISSAGLAIYRFMPQIDYLPDGNANFVFGRIIVPPGYSMDETLRIAEKMEQSARPLWQGETTVDGPPAISRFFFVAYAGGAFAGAAAEDPTRVGELRQVLSRPVFEEPGASAFVRQASLFGRSVGGSRSIRIDITGPDLDTITPVARSLNTRLARTFPRSDGNQIRTIPNLSSGTAQIRISPDPFALSAAGLTARQFAEAVDVLNDGLPIFQIPLAGNLIDLVLSGQKAGEHRLSDLGSLSVIGEKGEIYRIDQLAKVELISAPQEIRRIGGQQALSIQLRPNESVPLEAAIEQIENTILPTLSAELNSKPVQINVKGAASELARTWTAMQLNVLTAIGVIFLLLVVLLRSFILPAIILLVIPVASAGGIAGLAILNLFLRQPLDMLTMLGFVILTGIVVNNAILMIEQTVLHLKEDKMAVPDAIIEATQNRIRPIFMSTLTSLFGLVPLVIFPGAGSELYRGIGTVVFGGLALSTVATLLIVPPLLSIANASLINSAAQGHQSPETMED